MHRSSPTLSRVQLSISNQLIVKISNEKVGLWAKAAPLRKVLGHASRVATPRNFEGFRPPREVAPSRVAFDPDNLAQAQLHAL